MDIFDNPNLSDVDRAELLAIQNRTNAIPVPIMEPDIILNPDPSNIITPGADHVPVGDSVYHADFPDINPIEPVVDSGLTGDDLLMAQAAEYRKTLTPQQLGQQATDE